MGFLLPALVRPQGDPAPLGVGLGQCPDGTGGGSQRGAAQLAPSQLSSLVATLPGFWFPSFSKGTGGQSSAWRRGRVKETLSQGNGWGMQSTLGALKHGADPCTSVPSLAPLSSGDPFPGCGCVCGTEHLNFTQLYSLLAKLGAHPSGDLSPNPSAPTRLPRHGQCWLARVWGSTELNICILDHLLSPGSAGL